MKKRNVYIYLNISSNHLSPQYDLLGGNAGLPIFYSYSGGFA